MNRNTTIGLIALAIVLILAFIFLVLPSMENREVDNIEGDENTEVGEGIEDENGENTGAWETYESEAFNFSVEHRSDAEIRVEGSEENVVQFLFAGPRSVEGRALNDGYIFSVATLDMPEDMTLEAFANAQFEDSTETGAAVEPVTALDFGVVPAYRYRTSPLGILTTTYVLDHPQDGKAYSVSFAVADSGDSNYFTDVKRMLSSFRFSTR